MRNEIKIHGRLGRDPEIKEYTNSKGETGSRCTFSIARDDNGTVDWFNCVCFGKRGEAIEKWFKKGSPINVAGRMKSNKGKDDHIYWNLVVDDFEFTESKGNSDSKPSTSDDLPDSFEEQEADVPF